MNLSGEKDKQKQIGSKKKKQYLNKEQKNRKNSITCYYTNTDSLLNKKGELKVIINSCQPDILMITETLPKNIKSPPTKAEFMIDNYELYYNHDDSNCHRGVCIYIHHRLKIVK